jgi:hypothetical protein
MSNKLILFSCIIFLLTGCAVSKKNAVNSNGGPVLQADQFKHYVDYFNTMEDEKIIQAIPNAKSWEWMKANIPLFECPQQNIEQTYYFRWWTIRKHIKQTPQGYAFTEFLVNRTYADKYNLISSALGHHIYEARWLRDPEYINDDIHVWFRGNDGKSMKKLRAYSSWATDAIYNRFLVNADTSFLVNMLPDLETDYSAWKEEKGLPNGLFWQFDVRDGMEETISGGRKEKNERPSINSYMYGNAKALSQIEKIAGRKEVSDKYLTKADSIKTLVQQNLWNAEDHFFETVKPDGKSAEVREAIGFIPWYFNLPDAGYVSAWKQVTDTTAFLAPYGLTTAERSSPKFRTHGCCKCEWDGAIWPFATSQTMTALANVMNNYQQSDVTKDDYFHLLELYVQLQRFHDKPYIGEYLDEKTGIWLKGEEERGRYYNHSTFCDLIITGLVGLRPRADNIIEVNPLVPQNKWDWFCLDNVLYHKKNITIIWDKNGTKYKRGKGLSVWANGKKIASSDKLERITGSL